MSVRVEQRARARSVAMPGALREFRLPPLPG
jgi:hypothetical protein